MKEDKREVRGQASCEKYLRAITRRGDFKCYYSTQGGFYVAVVSGGQIVDHWWSIRSRGAIDEGTLKSMVEFINNHPEEVRE